MYEGSGDLLHDRRLRWGVLAVLFLLAAFLGVKTVMAMKEYRYVGGGVPVTNTITISGKGEEFSAPNVASFTFGVIERAASVQAAQKTATAKINAMVAYLKEQGIEDKDIKTVNYNIYPQYDYVQSEACTQYRCPPGRQVLSGFELNQSIEVKVRDVEKAGTLLSGVGERGANNVSSLNFTIDDEDELRRKARTEAIEDAQEKAKQLADDLGVRLVRVVSFSENGEIPYPIYYGKEAALGMGGDASAAPVVPAGENKIVSNVSITYEIR